MSNAPTPKVLLVGHGGMGRLYADALRSAGALAGVVVRSEASMERLSKSIAEPVFRNLSKAMEQQAPDALAVLSPTDVHAHHIRHGIRAGIPVMVIKPAAVRPDTARELKQEADNAGIPVLVAHEGVFAPAYRALEEQIQQGAIGSVLEVRWLKEGQDRLSGGRDADPIDDATEGRNIGHVYATAMHEIYVANRLAGGAAPVDVAVHHANASIRVPELDALFTYPGGLQFRLRYDGQPDREFRRGLQVIGTEGNLLWLVQPGATILRRRTAEGTRDLPFVGTHTSNPAEPVITELMEMLGTEVVFENLDAGANALQGARILAQAVSDHLSVPITLDDLAGGVDRQEGT
ncbi:MAG: hypothetical protein CMH54_13055 [Myxococcales bacterium]|nr:hypothetical protein [Myxococcales bacterium]